MYNDTVTKVEAEDQKDDSEDCCDDGGDDTVHCMTHRRRRSMLTGFSTEDMDCFTQSHHMSCTVLYLHNYYQNSDLCAAVAKLTQNVLLGAVGAATRHS